MDKKNIEAIYPLTSMQQILLLHAIQNPGRDLGLLQMQFELKGKVDVVLLETAWQELCNRHQTLRSAIYWEDLEYPLQVVQRKITPIWEHLDWSHLSIEQQEKKILTYNEELKKQEISLSQAPLVYVTLIQQADDHYHFICACHHILLDGLSGYLMVKELFRLYESQSLDTYKKMTRAFQFQNYVTWAQQQDLELAEIFWKKELEGVTSKTEWPKKLNDTVTTRNRQTLIISQTLTQQIQTLCKKEKITLNSFLIGIWSLLLIAYSGENDVVFGVTLAGRSAPLDGIENAVGMFSNVLPFRTRINIQEQFTPWLQTIAAHQVEISNYEYVTLSQIQSWCRTDIRSLFVFENHAQAELFDNNDLTVTNFKSGLTTNYPLTIVFKPGEQLELSLIYDHNYLSGEEIAEIRDNLQILVNQCVSQPQLQLGSLLSEIKVNKSYRSEYLSFKKIEKRVLDKPITLTEKHLANIWSEVLLLDEKQKSEVAIEIDRQDDFFYLGGHSIMIALLLSRIQEVFQVSLSLHQLFKYTTLKKLSKFIDDHLDPNYQFPSLPSKPQKSHDFLSFSQQKNWNLEQTETEKAYLSLVALQSNGSNPPLFCVPAAGNTAFGYASLARDLGEDQPVYGLQPLGLDEGTNPHDCIKEMSRHYLNEIQILQPKGPYYLVGVCFGCHVVFEMAQQLYAKGQTVAFLGLLDPWAPCSTTSDNIFSQRLKHEFYILKRKGLYAVIKSIMNSLYIRLRMRLGKIFHVKRVRIWNVLDSHLIALKNYVPEVFMGNVTLFRSSEYSNLEKERIGKWTSSWSDLIDGEFEEYVFPCKHEEILGSKIQLLTNQLKMTLDKAHTKHS